MMMEKEKVRTIGCVPTRDGRLHITLQFAATLSKGKAAYCFVFVFGLLLFVLAPFFGLRESPALQKRVQELEFSLSRRLSWVASHQQHLQRHLLRRSWTEDGPVSAFDGRRHLWSDMNGYSKLAEAMVNAGLETALPPVEDHYMCGRVEVTEVEVLRKKLAIAVVTWNAPLSLRNSMQSWRDGGLLDISDERMLFINSPTEEDRAIAREFEFDVYTTEERNGNIMAGPSLGYLSGNATADYLLFMEKDFVMSSDRDTMLKEMYAGVVSLARGVDVYRLRGRTDWPAEGMPNCCINTEPPQCPYNSEWASAGYFSDHMNWLRIFCVDDPVKDGRGQVVQCTKASPAKSDDTSLALAGSVPRASAVDAYCFSGGNSNWSNNPVMFPTAWFNEKLRAIAFKDWERNNMFEFNVMMEWLPWRPHAKVCVSYQGIFTHREIDQ